MKAKRRETFLRIFNLGVAEAICKPYLLTPSGMIFSPSGSEVGSDLGSCHALMPSSQGLKCKHHQLKGMEDTFPLPLETLSSKT